MMNKRNSRTNLYSDYAGAIMVGADQSRLLQTDLKSTLEEHFRMSTRVLRWNVADSREIIEVDPPRRMVFK